MAYRVQNGDTLVEVLMAIVILSLVIVGAMTLMTRGLAAAQIALEHSQVRMAVNGQTEMLRYARDSYLANPSSASAAQWSEVISASNSQPIAYDASCTVTGGKTGFYMSKSAAQVARETYELSIPEIVAQPGDGMWIESRLSSGITPAYVDFVIRACWQASGSGGQQQTVTAVRLYDPSR